MVRSVSIAARILDLLATEPGQVAVEPPGPGAGFWAGGPSVAQHAGVTWLAYRLRRPVDQGRGYANVVARSTDGVRFEPVATITAEQFGSASLERPALVRRPDGGWRLYVSCSSHGSKHWWVEALDADTPEGLPTGTRTMILPGGPDEAWKDVVVHREGDRWSMWACRHPLDGGDDHADRMTSCYFASGDGLHWSPPVTALAPRGAGWDARGTRLTSVLAGDVWTAFYDGRASAEENWFERTAAAEGAPDAFLPVTGPTRAGRTLRYLSVARTAAGLRLYWEAGRPDGANDLRTALLAS